jgi:hypothetical protein
MGEYGVPPLEEFGRVTTRRYRVVSGSMTS